MKLLRFHSALALTVASALTLAACGSEDEPDGGTTPTDTGGTADTGVPTDAGFPMDATTGDTGPRDTGTGDTGLPADTGVIVDPCTDGEEGCECTSSITALPFLQDDCQAGLVCVPWDNISGRTNLTGAFQTCVKPCLVDSECGTGRVCSDSFGLGATSGAEKICADATAGIDQFCGASRQTVSVVPMVNKETTQITACPTGTECTLRTFGDVHIDEGICLTFCQDNSDCAAPTPHCNPRFFTSNSTTTPFIGVCSEGSFGRGALCGTPEPGRLGLTAQCDTSEATCGANNANCPVCFAGTLSGLVNLPEGVGACLSRCSLAQPCETEAGLNETCIPDIFNAEPAGLCSVSCSNFPEDCPGDGAAGNGRTCVGGLQIAGEPLSFCLDKAAGTPLVAATLNSAGQITSEGDDCFGDIDAFSAYRCPRGASCLDDGQGAGLCVYGCGRTTPAGGDICRTAVSQTATCAATFTQDLTVGLCGDG